MRISAVLICHDDMPMLARTLPYYRAWADEIVVRDLGSSDGTLEFCHFFLRPTDVYQRQERNLVPQTGFSAAKNVAIQAATGDWVVLMAPNVVHDLRTEFPIRDFLATATQDVFASTTVNVFPAPEHEPLDLKQDVDIKWLERDLLANTPRNVEAHRWIFKRDAGYDLKGYIHEELYKGEQNAFSTATLAPLTFVHFQNWHHRRIRGLRYSWMIKRAMETPELQKYTNRYWFTTHWEKNKEGILQMAGEYDKYCQETGDM